MGLRCEECSISKADIAHEKPTRQDFSGIGSCHQCAQKDIAIERLLGSLEAAHFTDEGGKYWKPPVNHYFRELWNRKEQLREEVDLLPVQIYRAVKLYSVSDEEEREVFLSELRAAALKEE
jgi:hypothetical protein